jgi:hypothetical protein
MDFEAAVEEGARVNRAAQAKFEVASLRNVCGLLDERAVA